MSDNYLEQIQQIEADFYNGKNLEDKEDVKIDKEYNPLNFQMPDFEEIAAKEIFGSIIGVLNKNGEVVINHKFGKLNNNKKYYITLEFDTLEHSQMFLDNEKSESQLFPSVEIKHLEEKTLIAIYGVK